MSRPAYDPTRPAYGPYLKNHPLGTIRDIPETTKALAKTRKVY